MKKIIFIAVFLLSIFDNNADAQQKRFSQDFLVENYYIKASEISQKENFIFKNFTDSLQKNTPSCEYISANKKFYNNHDFVFEQLLLFQKVGKKNNDQNVDILRWVKERTSNYVVFNKLSESYKCISPKENVDDTLNQILGTLQKLGSLKNYMEIIKKSKNLSATSSPDEICDIFSKLNKESDKIEPYLEVLAIYYQSETSPITSNTTKTTLKLTFVHPEVIELTEKLLDFRNNYFLSQKKYIKTNLANYNCNK